MSTTENSFRTADFRGKLKRYNIDHIVEFQILVAVLLANEKYSEVEICEHFTEYFNRSWNLQIIPKPRHSDKRSNVSEYIRFKSNQRNSEPKSEIVKEISNIYCHYNKERNKICEYFRNNPACLILEESLWNFLNTNNTRLYKIPINEIENKSIELKEKFKQNQIDHIVELQILTCVLTNSEVSSKDLALKFIKYFHQDWNFKNLDRDINNRKGQMVQKWIMWIKGDSPINVNKDTDEMFKTIKTIFDHYTNNIHIVKSNIESLSDVNDKNQLITVANDLLALFQNNIPH